MRPWLMLLVVVAGCATVTDPGADWVCGVPQEPTGDLERDIVGLWLERAGGTATAWDIRGDGTALSNYLNRATGTRAEQSWNWFAEGTEVRLAGDDAESRFSMKLTGEGWSRSGVDSWERCRAS